MQQFNEITSFEITTFAFIKDIGFNINMKRKKTTPAKKMPKSHFRET